ncbi:MAG: hypothetical protein Q9178_003454 [Gyalolechia marmorata]
MLIFTFYLILLFAVTGLAQSPNTGPVEVPAEAQAGQPAPKPDSNTPVSEYRYPPDSPTESWPKIIGWNLSVSTDPLPYAARHLPRTTVIALMVEVLREARQHVITQGDEIIPSNLDVSVIEVASRGIKFEICRLVAAGLTQWYADPEGEAAMEELRWSDIVPIITVLRAKMQRDSQWRERAVWIRHSETNVRLGMAKIVSRFPGFEPGDPYKEPGKCEY